MTKIVLETERLRAVIGPALGGGLFDFSMPAPDGSWRPLLRRAPDDAAHFNDLACYVLAPWSNRIAGAEFPYAARDVRLRADWPDGTAIHGAVKDQAFRIVDRTPVSARLLFESLGGGAINWPWAFESTVRYELHADALDIALTVTNRSDEPFPVGGGFHPCFPRRLWDERDAVRVAFRTGGRYPLARVMPTGPARPDGLCAFLAADRPFPDIPLDDVFAGFDGRAVITWPSSGVALRFECSETLSHAVVYNPRPGAPGHGAFFCVEPVSMVNNGFALRARGADRTGVVILEPGRTFSARFTLHVTPA